MRLTSPSKQKKCRSSVLDLHLDFGGLISNIIPKKLLGLVGPAVATILTDLIETSNETSQSIKT